MVSTNKFSYDPTTKTFSAERSDLPPTVVERIYPDAADIGIRLVSHKTGEKAKFYQAEEVWSHGDLTHWIFYPTTETVRRLPNLANVKIIIFND